jgi:hypothetical protein
MQVYIVWNLQHDFEDDSGGFSTGDITGVYTNELTAYKTACIKQVHEHLYYYNECDEIEGEDEKMKEWLCENSFPNPDETDVDIWKKYFDIVSDDDFVYKIKQDKKNIHVPPYKQYNVTKKEVE